MAMNSDISLPNTIAWFKQNGQYPETLRYCEHALKILNAESNIDPAPRGGQSEIDLYQALYALSFGWRGVVHFGACGIRTTDHCTTPQKCERARKALESSAVSWTGASV
jgi:hypothetical protein